MTEQKDIGTYFDQTFFENYLALENSPIFQKMIGHTIEQNLPNLQNKNAYDVGFGMGFGMKILLRKQLKSYTGLDLNPDMTTHLEKIASQIDPRTEVTLLQGDNTKPIQHKHGPFDFVISSFAIYADSYNKLLGHTKHLKSAVNNEGTVFMLTFHADFVHDDKHSDVIEDQYNHYFSPKLQHGQKYEEFQEVELIAKPPYIKNEVRFNEEYVLNRNTVKKALKEAGFKYIMRRDMTTAKGYEEVGEFGRAFGINLFVCK